jgi:cell division protein FtsQ
MTDMSTVGPKGSEDNAVVEGSTLRRAGVTSLNSADAATASTAGAALVGTIENTIDRTRNMSIDRSIDGAGDTTHTEVVRPASHDRWRRLWGGDTVARSRRRATVKVAGLLGCVGIVWALAVSPLLAAQEVHVEGLVNLTPAQIEAAGGFGVGTPLLLVRPDEVEARLEASPWIRSATVVRQFPQSISVTIVEREPVAAVARGSRWVTVDASGRAMQVTDVAPVGLPALTPADESEVTDVWLTGSARLAAGVIGFVPTAWRDAFSTWVIDDDGTLQARLDGGITVEFGVPARGQAKVVAALTVIAHSGRDRPGVLDVRVPEVPLWRGASGSSSVD